MAVGRVATPRTRRSVVTVPPSDALAAALEDETTREILEEVLRLGPRDRKLLLGIARQISSAPEKA